MKRWPWIERKFTFDFPPEKMPDLIERLRGAPVRMEEHVRGLRADELLRQVDSGWTIQQNVGHLLDTEYLPLTRVGQILAGEPKLAAADMTNRRTTEGAFNARPMNELLAAFRQERAQLVAAFEKCSEADWARAAVHPRLQQTMRLADLAYFTAEHDDYHLTRIAYLRRQLGK